MNYTDKYTWVPFIREMMQELVRRHMADRSELIMYLEGNVKANDLKELREDNGAFSKDIDPISILNTSMAYFKAENILHPLPIFKQYLALEAELPTDVKGWVILGTIKQLNRSVTTKEDIDTIWNLADGILKDADIEGLFNHVLNIVGSTQLLSTWMYYLNPERFVPSGIGLERYCKDHEIDYPKKIKNYRQYVDLCNEIIGKLATEELEENNILELVCTLEGYVGADENKLPKMWIWHEDDLRDAKTGESYLSNGILPFNNSNGDDALMEGNYESVEAYGKAMGKDYQKRHVQYAFWLLANEVEEGDVIVLIEGRYNIKAWGYISSTARIDMSRDIHKYIKVNWENIQDYQSPFPNRGLFFQKATLDKAKILTRQLNIPNFKDLSNRQSSQPNISVMANSKYQEYIDLLKENKNLILTGAPGTGKTYMAKEIAKEMGAITEFVQFHPSYDYTDFVEGLRPIEKGEDQVGFRRMDGIFKRFCKKAILDEATNDDSVLKNLNTDPTVWKVSLGGAYNNPTRMDCLRNGYIRIGWDGYGDIEDFNDFDDFHDGGRSILRAFQSEMKVGDIVVSCYSQNETDAIGIVTGDYEYNEEGGDMPRYRSVEWLIKDVRINMTEILGKKMVQATVYKLNVSVPQILDIVRKNQSETVTTTPKNKPYIMIIDEINRGDLSKIFGELFYTIDPGYRGEAGRVKTQFQNLIDESDIFAGGFYIPENVYVLATMNDIDRSVESMDFAMRRRFTWKEVTPNDTADMLNSLGDIAEEAKSVMNRLNKAIAEADGLGAAYMVGPSYFLKLKNNAGDFSKLWGLNIKPLLQEYLRGIRNADDTMQKFHDAYCNNQL